MILILENAINYNSLEEAKEMILKGKELTEKTGIKTLSKFQLYRLENITDPKYKQYCLDRMLNFNQAKELFDYGRSIEQDVFFTPMFVTAVDWCEEIGVRYYKIRYYDRKNEKILKKCLNTKKPIFLSNDTTTIQDHQIDQLFCIPKYPAELWDYIVGIPTTFWSCFSGISDHTPDLELLKETIKEGVEYFERHVCLDRNKETCLEKEWCSSFSELEDVLK